jgi:SAM-dependent methyltransferase
MIPKQAIRAGIALYAIDKAISIAFRRRRPVRMDEKMDKTGRVTQAPQALKVIRFEPDVHLVNYPGNYSHSMWRSQELSLFVRYKDFLVKPRLDFGCGDGSFAFMLFDRVEYGLDMDEKALRVAAQYRVYERIVCSDGALLPIRPGSLGSIFSNSVLEHVDKLKETISGLHESLAPGGFLLFTVPVLDFASHLRRFFGERESERINQLWYHRHLHPSQWWSDLLQKQNFEVRRIDHYQPDWFTLAYFTFTTRAFRVLFRFGLAENERYRRMVARMVATSIASTKEGGNIFVIAQRSK